MDEVKLSAEVVGVVVAVGSLLGAAIVRGVRAEMKKTLGTAEKSSPDSQEATRKGDDQPTVMSRLGELLATAEGMRGDITELRRKIDDEVKESAATRGAVTQQLKDLGERLGKAEDNIQKLNNRTLGLYREKGMTPRAADSIETPPEPMPALRLKHESAR